MANMPTPVDSQRGRRLVWGNAMRLAPNLGEERALWLQGVDLVAGVDEVGRGPLAGPVVAGAVVLTPSSDFRWLFHVRDSKLLDAPRREGAGSCRTPRAIGSAARRRRGSGCGGWWAACGGGRSPCGSMPSVCRP